MHTKQTGVLSGGNKRKLSLACALVGDPSVLLLDEPTCGIDFAARKKMWIALSQISQQRSVILTSHSMTETEVLCSRVGIMVNGEMKCIG
jgi:ATP-binding cassette, subfamily A (ABC1), member 3